MAFVTQDDVFAALEPVLASVFSEFGGPPVTAPPFPRIPYRRGDAEIRHRQARPAQSAVMADVSELFRGSGFGLFARASTRERWYARFRSGCGAHATELLRQAQRLGEASRARVALAISSSPMARHGGRSARTSRTSASLPSVRLAVRARATPCFSSAPPGATAERFAGAGERASVRRLSVCVKRMRFQFRLGRRLSPLRTQR